MDSGAFTEVMTHGEYRTDVLQYAIDAVRWASPKLKGVVAQDYMCEAVALKKTGLTIKDHQTRTIKRYVELKQTWALLKYFDPWPPIIPVLQGSTVEDYVSHLRDYGDLIEVGAWVGVGSVCKRQGDPRVIEEILMAIATVRPDIRLHGFGVKLTALKSFIVRALLGSSDSMAWSFAARRQGRDANSVLEAIAFAEKVNALSA